MSLKSENNWIWIQYQILFQSESLPVLQCKGEGEGTEPWGPPDAQTGNGTHPDSGSVVLNLQQLQAAVFHGHLDVCGLCIQTETLKHIHVGFYSCVELSLNTWRDFRQTYYLFFFHYQFSIISFTAFAGRWITSPAAMRFTTVSSSRRMTPAMFFPFHASRGSWTRLFLLFPAAEQSRLTSLPPTNEQAANHARNDASLTH